MKTKIINGWKYETETHDFNKTLSEIKIPKGWELWEASDFQYFGKKEFDELNLWNSWFLIKQPIKAMEEKGYVAGFIADPDGAVLGCSRDPADRFSVLGVRFKKKVKK